MSDSNSNRSITMSNSNSNRTFTMSNSNSNRTITMSNSNKTITITVILIVIKNSFSTITNRSFVSLTALRRARGWTRSASRAGARLWRRAGTARRCFSGRRRG